MSILHSSVTRYNRHKFDLQGYYLDSSVKPSKDFPEGSFYGIATKGYGVGSEPLVVDRNEGKSRKFVGKAVGK